MDELSGLLDYLSGKLWHLENAYLVLRETHLHYNAAVDRQAAEAYVKVVSAHKGFFIPVVQALEFELFTGLHSFLGKKDARSLGRAINKLSSSKGGIDLTKQYDALISKHAKIIQSLKILRDKRLAHDDAVKIESADTLTSDEQLISLFSDMKHLLNSALRHFGSETWFMDGDSREAIKDTHDMMDNLLRGEAQRLGEIEVEFASKVFRSGREKWLNTR